MPSMSSWGTTLQFGKDVVVDEEVEWAVVAEVPSSGVMMAARRVLDRRRCFDAMMCSMCLLDNALRLIFERELRFLIMFDEMC